MLFGIINHSRKFTLFFVVAWSIVQIGCKSQSMIPEYFKSTQRYSEFTIDIQDTTKPTIHVIKDQEGIPYAWIEKRGGKVDIGVMTQSTEVEMKENSPVIEAIREISDLLWIGLVIILIGVLLFRRK